MKPTTLPAIALATLMSAGCSASTDAEEEPPRLPEVAWQDYGGSWQQIIDEDRVARNCRGLQEVFDSADRMDGGADIMGYADASMKYAGCYGDEPVALDVDGCAVTAPDRTPGQRDFAEAMGCD